MIIIGEIVRALEVTLKEKVQNMTMPKWQAPGAGWIKLNTDGGYGLRARSWWCGDHSPVTTMDLS